MRGSFRHAGLSDDILFFCIEQKKLVITGFTPLKTGLRKKCLQKKDVWDRLDEAKMTGRSAERRGGVIEAYPGSCREGKALVRRLERGEAEKS